MFSCEFILDRNKWNHLTAGTKMNSGSFKKCYQRQEENMYLMYMYEKD